MASEPRELEIVIVGGGASGTLLALQLARMLPSSARLTIVEPAAELGRGAAYSTPLLEHLLNVPAGGMSAFEGEPDDFVNWVSREKPEARAADLRQRFLPRAWYGAYLGALARERCARILGPRFTHVRATAVAAELDPSRGPRWRVTLGDENGAASKSRELIADELVLALGNFRPEVPEGIPREVVGAPAWIGNAWHFEELRTIPQDAPVGILGTGLTMVDVVIALRAFGHRGKITAVSRKGLLPRPHQASAVAFAGARGFLSENTALGLFRRFRDAVREHESRGGLWQDVFAAFRQIATAVWENLDARERTRFLRRLKSYWEVHRHRVPAGHLAAIEKEIREGTLRIVPGRVRSAGLSKGGIELCLESRGRSERVSVAFLVNATGPINDFRASPKRAECLDCKGASLVASLREQGFVIPDPAGLGLEVDEKLRVLGMKGGRKAPTPSLYALGALTKGRFWEVTAVPDIRRQAEALALTLTGR